MIYHPGIIQKIKVDVGWIIQNMCWDGTWSRIVIHHLGIRQNIKGDGGLIRQNMCWYDTWGMI
jgi:hypothetical protein